MERKGERKKVHEFYRDLIGLAWETMGTDMPVLTVADGIFSTYRAGYAMAFGASWWLAGSYRLGSHNTVVCFPETAMGLLPVAATPVLQVLKHPGLGLYLALTGRRLKGSELLYD